jgi:DNA-binding transcriptional LysR family regulator
MDIAKLQAFVAVASHGSFTRAAESLHRSQPGVSRQIKRLESEMGTPLLDRIGSSVTTTKAGVKFLAFAERTLDEFRRLEVALQGETRALSGVLHIAASTTPGQFLVPTLVASLVERYPDIEAEVAIMDSESVAADVSDGGCDVGFMGTKIPSRKLRYTIVAEDEIVLAVPSAHRFAGRQSIALAELAGERMLEREGGSGTRASVLRAMKERGLKLSPPHIAMVLGTTEAVVSAVEQDHGIGWVSSLALQHRDHGRVALVRVREVPIVRPLYLVHPPLGSLSPVASAFVDWVTEAAPLPRPR